VGVGGVSGLGGFAGGDVAMVASGRGHHYRRHRPRPSLAPHGWASIIVDGVLVPILTFVVVTLVVVAASGDTQLDS